VTASAACPEAAPPPPQRAAAAAGCLAVQEVHVQVESGSMDALFASCRDVTVAATGQRAMEMVFGGGGSADAFLAFQGESPPSRAPRCVDCGLSPFGVLACLSIWFGCMIPGQTRLFSAPPLSVWLTHSLFGCISVHSLSVTLHGPGPCIVPELTL